MFVTLRRPGGDVSVAIDRGVLHSKGHKKIARSELANGGPENLLNDPAQQIVTRVVVLAGASRREIIEGSLLGNTQSNNRS
jgi:hypothetical protein